MTVTSRPRPGHRTARLPESTGPGASKVSVVIATMNRVGQLRRTLSVLERLPERPPVLVVDNGSTDGTAAAVAREHPGVRVISLPENIGCGARNVGVAQADTDYVAFADDDSWWAPGSLARAARLLDEHPRLAVVAARMLVGPHESLDLVSSEMATGPLPAQPDLPGPPVLGFLACGVVVRRAAFLAVGGFDARLMIGGEEELLAIDLVSAGWGLAYVDDVVAHHHPLPRQDGQLAARRRIQARNALWTAWLRRRLPGAVRRTVQLGRGVRRDAAVRAGFLDAVRGVPWVLRRRDPVAPGLEAALRLMESAGSRARADSAG